MTDEFKMLWILTDLICLANEKLAAYWQTAKHDCRSTIRSIYSRTLVTQALKGKRKTIELGRVQVIRIDCKIQLSVLKIESY